MDKLEIGERRYLDDGTIIKRTLEDEFRIRQPDIAGVTHVHDNESLTELVQSLGFVGERQ